MKRFKSMYFAFCFPGLGLALAVCSREGAVHDSLPSTRLQRNDQSKKKSTDASSTDSTDASSSGKSLHVEIDKGKSTSAAHSWAVQTASNLIRRNPVSKASSGDQHQRTRIG